MTRERLILLVFGICAAMAALMAIRTDSSILRLVNVGAAVAAVCGLVLLVRRH